MHYMEQYSLLCASNTHCMRTADPIKLSAQKESVACNCSNLWGRRQSQQCFFEFFLLQFHTRYMFRSLWAIFRWNIYQLIPRSYLCYNRSIVLLKLLIACVCIGLLFCCFCRRCLYVCSGYDFLLFVTIFPILSYYIKIN
jgi:hypothetical protein